MQFTSVGYLIFFAVTAAVYLCAPRRAQNAVLLAASAVYYALNLSFAPQTPLWRSLLPAAVLACATAFTYGAARVIDGSTGKKRAGLTAAAVCVCVAVLAFFKYNGFIVPCLLGAAGFEKLGLPLGISFYTFTAVAYLVDVYRGDVKAERNFIRYAAFLLFFGTITSGPICRAGKILPQLQQQHKADYARTANHLRRALVGYFKWIAVANVLGLFTNKVFENVRAYSGGVLTAACIMYALQLYFEFSGYSDIALASGGILGIELPVNFNTPYFATNFSGFWNRWHISLSNWLNDYIFMPLVWGGWQRKIPVLGKKLQNPPVLFSLFAVFFISGLWHGNTLPFVIWGLLQAAYRIGEELLHKYYKKPAKRPPLWLRCLKTGGVFTLWSASLVFFRIGLVNGAGLSDAWYVLSAQFSPSAAGFMADMRAITASALRSEWYIIALYFVFLAVGLSAGIYMDHRQCFALKGKRHISETLFCRKTPVRWLLYWAMVVFILAGFILQSGGFAGGSFTYANF